ncbi:hypothetical protein NM688_g7559 [Phlebia brevispora]|uniref:Uncharacterized protein n=1 Tax=Phlebia brevispora TaxID=194682 RepID=A0ACC1S439_9APHY|nr:hypothetical protein NM688_g7559 [Phlebia brevispora]
MSAEHLSVEKRAFGSVSSASTGGASEQSGAKSEYSSTKLLSPLDGISQEDLLIEAEQFAFLNGLEDHKEIIKRGALVAQNPKAFEKCSLLSEDEKEALRRERAHPWTQPFKMYYLVVICSLAAAVQGMDESVINGANLFFPTQFGINPESSRRNQWLLGLVNAAPYVRCVRSAVVSCN